MSDASIKMDTIYRWQTGVYDVTRRYYLLGREPLIEAMAPSVGANVLEIGCGTGRNLVKAACRWPDARFFGIDVSQAMLGKALESIERAGLSKRISIGLADATSFNAGDVFGEFNFQRVYFSYTLSMIPDWRSVLERAADMLPPGGILQVTDFGSLNGLPPFLSRALLAWLALFSVTPNHSFEAEFSKTAFDRGFDYNFIPLYRGYSFLAAMRRPE